MFCEQTKKTSRKMALLMLLFFSSVASAGFSKSSLAQTDYDSPSTASETGSCDPLKTTSSFNRYPPAPVDFSAVSRSGLQYTWTISNQTHGNGKYIAKASSVYMLSSSNPWHASYAFDHNPHDDDSTTTWHKARDSTDPHWLTLEMPGATKLHSYTLSSRKGCCASQFPQKWSLYCADPDNSGLIDTRTGQTVGNNQCKIYQAKSGGFASACKKYKIVIGEFSSLRELAFYGIDASAVFKPASRADLTAAIVECLKLSDDCSKGPKGLIIDWDVSGVTDMSQVFAGEKGKDYYVSGAERFDSDISKWDVSRVTNMHFMFSSAKAFNGDVSKWDVSSVTSMQDMFAAAETFNGDVSNWDVGRVAVMRGMFYEASAFNGDISKWDVSRVTTMMYMFLGAGSFSQTLCGAWAVSKADQTRMFEGSKGTLCQCASLCVRALLWMHACVSTYLSL